MTQLPLSLCDSFKPSDEPESLLPTTDSDRESVSGSPAKQPLKRRRTLSVVDHNSVRSKDTNEEFPVNDNDSTSSHDEAEHAVRAESSPKCVSPFTKNNTLSEKPINETENLTNDAPQSFLLNKNHSIPSHDEAEDADSAETSPKRVSLFTEDNTVNEKAINETENLTGDALQSFLLNELLGPCDDDLDEIVKLSEAYKL